MTPFSPAIPSWNSTLGDRILSGECTLEDLERHAVEIGEPVLESGREEMLESIFNDHIR